MRLCSVLLLAGVATAALGLPAAASADPGSQIGFSPLSTDFGGVGVETSANQLLTLKNSSGLAAILTGAQLTGPDADQFAIDSSSCGPTLPAPSDCAFGIAFEPTRTGPASATLEVGTDGLISPATLQLSGNGATPQLSVPGELGFGTTLVNRDEPTQGVFVQNSGSTSAAIHTASIDGPDASAFTLVSDGCRGWTLSPGANCNLQVRFSPDAGRDFHATLTIDVGGGARTVSLSGTGAISHVTSRPGALEFGAQPLGGAAAQTVAFSNDGTLPFQTIVALVSGGDVGAFHVDADGCGLLQVLPGQSCAMTVRFAPQRLGHAEARLLLIAGEDEPVLVPLRGEGTAAVAGGGTTPSAGAGSLGPAGSAGSSAATLGPASSSSAGATSGRVRVVLQRRSLRHRDGRISVAARCAGAETCRVETTGRLVVATAAGLLRARAIAPGRWQPADGARIRLWLPTRAGDVPRYLVLTLTTTAAGRRTTTRTAFLRFPAAATGALPGGTGR